MPTIPYDRPDTDEYAPYYGAYVNQVPAGDLLTILADQMAEIMTLLRPLSEEKASFAYAPGKWTIKQVVGHLIDTERVFSYRLVSFARADPSPLPSFDENAWIGPAQFNDRSLTSLVDELVAVRSASIALVAGLLGVAAAAGVVFARISRPRAGVVFSSVAAIAPYRGGKALMFRVANARRSELIQVQAVVNFSLLKTDGSSREFKQLTLERNDVVFMPTSWTVVHPIDSASPLYSLDRETLIARAPEMFVLLTAVEEVFSQTVHARASYAGDEFVWGARFANINETDEAGVVIKVDVSRLSDVEPVPLPA